MLGKELEPILNEIAITTLECNHKPNYSEEAFLSIVQILMHAVMDRMWDVQEADKMDTLDRENMAEKCGNELSKFIKTYTGINTKK